MSECLSDRVKKIAKSDIYAIVSERVELHADGKDYKGDCPFCYKNQCFTIAPSYGMFYCFGCQRGGDPIAFLQLTTKKTVDEIVEELAKKYELD